MSPDVRATWVDDLISYLGPAIKNNCPQLLAFILSGKSIPLPNSWIWQL
jgi:hypothetical protein